LIGKGEIKKFTHKVEEWVELKNGEDKNVGKVKVCILFIRPQLRRKENSTNLSSTRLLENRRTIKSMSKSNIGDSLSGSEHLTKSEGLCILLASLLIPFFLKRKKK